MKFHRQTNYKGWIMRLTSLLLALSVTGARLLAAGSASSQDLREVKVTLDLRGEPLKSAFSAIERQTAFRFAYSDQQVSKYQNITLIRANASLQEVLRQLLSGTQLAYKQVDNKIVVFTSEEERPTSGAEAPAAESTNVDGGTIQGTITNDKGDPSSGASISLVGTDKGAAADALGKYIITGIPPGKYKLAITAVGFLSAIREVTIKEGESLTINIQLKAGHNDLDEVVVTGYSRQSKRDVTGAVSTLSGNIIAQTPVTDIGTTLQGRVAGVSVDDQGGPGSSATVRIRGVGTLGDNDPLYVIDGVQIRMGEGGTSQDISNLINTNDIETMTILKDPSTTALYGASGGNGVIVITTKSGKIGTPKLDYSTYLGYEMPIKLPAIMSPGQYANAYWGYLQNSGLPTTSSLYGNGSTPVLPYWIIESNQFANNPKGVQQGDPAADPSLYDLTSTSQSYRIMKANQGGTDWFKQVFKSAFTQNHQLSLSGATDKSNYALTLNYADDKGTLLYTYFKRYSLRTNTEFKVKPWLRVGENVLFSYTQTNGLNGNHSSSNEISNLYQISPLLPVYDIKGNLTGTKFGGGTDGIGSLVGSNPIYSRQSSLNGTGFSAGIIGSSYLDLEPIRGLVLETKIGVQFLPYESRYFTDSSMAERYAQSTNSFNEGSGYSTDWRWTNKVSYEKTLKGIHHISAFVAYESHAYATRYISGNTLSLPYTTQSYQYLSDGIAITGPTVIVGGGGDKYASASAFGNINYALMDKYLLSFVLRRDGSSRFGPDKQYGTFPGGSVGWRISQEQFMKGISWLNDLKFRASYGTVGNDAIGSGAYSSIFGLNPYVTQYALTGSNVSAQTGFALLQIGNPNIHWEVNSTTNIGFDATLLRGVTVNFNWFNRVTKDLLYAPPSTQTAGAALPPIENIMRFSNKGVELELGYSSPQIGRWRFEMNGNISTYRNKVLYISGSPSDYTLGVAGSTYSSGNHFILTRSVVGRPVSSFYGYQQTGIFQSATDYTNYNVTEPGITTPADAPGHFKFKDISGSNGKPDGKIDANDQTFIGSPMPKFSYGYNFTLFYRNFDLGIFLQGVYGNKIFNYWRESSEWPGALGAGSLNTWSTTNTHASLPIWNNNVNTLDNNPSSFFVESGSYMRIKQMQLGYTFGKIKGITRLRLYVQAYNFFTFTHYSGIDPEVNSGNPNDIGVDFGGTYPVSKKILFGINLGL
jgi:TonB-linked SusC/RagA family outer membrane protein